MTNISGCKTIEELKTPLEVFMQQVTTLILPGHQAEITKLNKDNPQDRPLIEERKDQARPTEEDVVVLIQKID